MNAYQQKVLAYSKPLLFLLGLLIAFTVCGYVDGIHYTLLFNSMFAVLIVAILGYLVFWYVKLDMLKPQLKKDVPQ